MDYLFADCETTGVGLSDKMVEIAYAIYDQHLALLARDESLIDPEMPIPFGASAVHHITNTRVQYEPTIEEYMVQRNYPLQTEEPMMFVAHNAAFDIRYFGPWLHPDTKILCTLRLAKRLYPGLDSYKLQALRYALELPEIEGDAHRAGFDVDVLISLVQHMLARTGLDMEGLYDLSQAPLEVTKMPFGKHKGLPLAQVPKDYVRWLLAQDGLDADLRYSLQALL